MRLSFFFVPMLLQYSIANLATTTLNNLTDQSALLAFKAHVGDYRSVLANNWSISHPICSWVGISCDSRHQRVKALNLSGMGLGGTIPPHLGNLSFLMSLDVTLNNFYGHLPNELGKLGRLKFISFSFNKLSGSIPTWIGVLSKLQIMSLRNNNITGPIPNSLFNLSKLEMLQASFNVIDGNIPSGIGNLSNLFDLDLRHNNLQDQIPTEIGNLQNLESLALGTNNLSGLIPPAIFNISTIRVLNLHSNQFSGRLPSTIGHSLPNIEYLTLAINNLIGTIPDSLTNASKLIGLDLGSNSFSGHIPNTFGNLRHLNVLSIRTNNLTTESSSADQWSFLSSLTNCRKLSYLVLDSNPLGGILPPLIGNFSASLQSFYAYECKLGGSIPKEIGNLRGLILLTLDFNDLNGTIPTSVGTLQQLQGLSLEDNNLEGSIPYDLCHLELMYGIRLNGNKLSGHIPPCLASLTSLRELRLGSNKLTSSIPSSLWSLEYILEINLSSNSLNDSLPSNVQKLKVLRVLDLSRNQLSGSFGSVYKGTISDGTDVAIKVFNLQLERAFRSFDSECEVLQNVRHRNLIKILSSCSNPDFKALVLEFMPNGSLEKWLYSHNYFLDILERLNIMIDVGSALEYLHHGHSSAPIIHCDLKPPNILLDENMVAHVSDFGISKLLGEEEDSVTQTMTMATIGYMAPEYGSEGIVSAKCDVYSYGVLLMETFTRKRPTDEMFTGETSLRTWVKESLPHGLSEVVDANLVREEQAFSAKMDCILSIMDLALDCCMESPDMRINMTDAAAKLKRIKVKFLDDAAATN
ncbi:protein kinase domain-containing protein [Citrus sinensis]|uniref:Protein kinase domain-containing protein n=1 Tax=Citrus sinensis TaxID=2711 RepID=A0ACB8LZS3_CITSI|nr:protein kinase domain-containing protein [Citrus sinensis]